MSSALEIDEGDLGKIYDDLIGAASKWYNIGLQLGLSDDRLDCIERNNRGVVEDCLREMLKTWLRTSQPTWKSIVDALESKSVGRKQLAKKMRKYCITKEPAQVQESKIQGKPMKIILPVIILLLAAAVCYFLAMIGKPQDRMNAHHSISLPRKTEYFVGRDQEVHNVSHQLNFLVDSAHILNIIGGPGIGKSSLAVSVGHQMLSSGIAVYYVDMTEVTSMQTLAEKIIEGDENIVSYNITVETMYKWARQLHNNTLLILDNCDDMLNKDLERKELPTVVKTLLKNSEYLKVLTTSRESTMRLSTFHLKWLQLNELKVNASCELLQSYYEQLTTTECERIAYLTGNVPLALKVVGSLLDQPNPPGPAIVIENLEKNLIPALSPEELPVEERVNACIDMSYNYLKSLVQKIGHFLVHFPGSFSMKTACGIFNSSKTVTCDNISSAVELLVQRSLLHRNKLSHTSKKLGQDIHYHFHKLIREFFLDKQRKIQNPKQGYERISSRFNYGFRAYFGHLSLELKFLDSASALEILDEERHNFMYFLQLSCRFHTIKHFELFVIQAVIDMFDSNLLQYRFTSEELYYPTECMTRYLQKYCILSQPNAVCSSTYVSLVLRLADFVQNLNGTSEAMMLLDSELRQGHIETLKTLKQGSTLYIRFYAQLANYYDVLGKFEKVRVCHEKIRHELEIYNLTYCDYVSIGNAFQYIGKYTEAIYLLELAMKEGELDLFSKVCAINTILKAYEKIQYPQHKKEKRVVELVKLVPLLINTSNLEIYNNFERISSTVSLLRTEGRTEEANSLEEKQLNAVKESGSWPLDRCDCDTSTIITLELAKSFYNSSQYSRCINTAEVGLQVLKSKQVPNYQIDMRLLIAKAKFFSGNYSESSEFFELAIGNILEQNQTDKYRTDIVLACPLLMLKLHGSFECVVMLVLIFWSFCASLLLIILLLFCILWVD